MKRISEMLKGGDLRSIGNVNQVIDQIKNQQTFNELFSELFNCDRKVVMRAADAIEKITVGNPGYLNEHKEKILMFCNTAQHVELKWHLALLVPRLNLSKKEIENVWKLLKIWVTDKNESKIVRVNSLQGLHTILQDNKKLLHDFNQTINEIEQENIPSINARIKKLKNSEN